jgi:hypothetical protein
MSDIVERLVTLAACGSFGSRDAAVILGAADEIERLRGQLENVQRDRMAQVEVKRLRALITEWVDADREFNQSISPYAAKRFVEAIDALRKEAGR